MAGFVHVPINDVKALEKAFEDREVCGFMAEPIQGEGGYIVPPAGFLPGLRKLCDEHGILLVLDEVQSGMGRTGKMWAADHFHARPDIMTIAKGIASGMPLSAMVARKNIMRWTPGAHASTFGGNPVSIAASLATIELLEAIRGTARAVTLRRPQPCVSCDGVGSTAPGVRCGTCAGTGLSEETSRLNVKIPAGVDTGARVRVSGKGGYGVGGAPSGDLFVLVKVKEHPFLTRDGVDLTLEIPVTVAEALAGATIKVPTPDGDLSLKLPPGTPSGKRFRVKGRGVPDLRGGTRGDLFVRPMVHVPEPSEAAVKLAQGLDELYADTPRKAVIAATEMARDAKAAGSDNE